ncbi:unnamed protein product [Pylaiella littoralis]
MASRNELHFAARIGSAKHVVALLSRGLINIDEGDPAGTTPLIEAASGNHPCVVRILLDKGANPSIVDECGYTALLRSAGCGHLAVTEMLTKAVGAEDLEAETCHKVTSIYLAADKGHSEVVRVLIDAGAKVDIRDPVGGTPLFRAAAEGHLGVVVELLRAKANPLLAKQEPTEKLPALPLDVAARCEHVEVVHELIQQLGLDGCGGESGGANALLHAGFVGHMGIIAMLTDAGVVDTGVALNAAASKGNEAAVKFLLRQKEGDTTYGDSYVTPAGIFVRTSPLITCIFNCCSGAPRVARLLVDAGIDTTSAVRLTTTDGRNAVFDDTPKNLVIDTLRKLHAGGGGAGEGQQRSRLEAIRRLLLQVEAVHATSWLWPKVICPAGHAAGDASRSKMPPSGHLKLIWRRAGRLGVLEAALARHSGKP